MSVRPSVSPSIQQVVNVSIENAACVHFCCQGDIIIMVIILITGQVLLSALGKE